MPRLKIALPVVLAAAVFLCGLGVHPLHEPDEGRYGEIAREMVATGDVVTPRLDGIRYFEKPPLFFWLEAAGIRALGATEAAVRLPSALAAIASVALALAIGRRAFGRRAGALGALLLATTPLLLLVSRLALVDVTLCALVTASLAALHEAAIAGDDAPARRGPGLAFWGAAGFGFLCKGPIAVALPVAAALPFLLLDEASRRLAHEEPLLAVARRPLVRALASPLGIALFFAIAAPWYVAMERANPGYFRTFIVEQNLHRLLSAQSAAKFGRDEPLWYYLAPLAGLFAPWTLLLPAAVARAGRSAWSFLADGAAERADRSRAFLACAVVGPLALLSIAHSKLPYYLLPLFPPMAVLAAEAVVRGEGRFENENEYESEYEYEAEGPRPSRGLARAFAAVAGIVLAAALGAMVVAHAPKRVLEEARARLPEDPDRATRFMERIDVVLHILPAGSGAAALLGLGAAASALLFARGRRARAPLPLVAALALAGAAAPWLGPVAERAYSGRDVARAAARGLAPEDTVVLFKRFYRTVPFYLERTVLLYDARFSEFGEEPGPADLAGHALLGEDTDTPALVERAEAALAALWRGPGRVVAICDDAQDRADLARICGAATIRETARLGTTTVVENREPLHR